MTTETVNQDQVFRTSKLPNGLEVVGQPLPGVQSVAFGLFVGTGARDEVGAQAGISHLTEATMLRGTEQHTSRDLSDRLDRLGVGRGSSTGIEMSLFSAVLLADNLIPALELLTEVVATPSFPENELEAVRALQIQEIGQREDQPAQMVMDRARQTYFAGTPLANDVLGSVESVSRLSRDQVVEYWTRRYTSNNVVLSIAGAFDWESVLSSVAELTVNWGPGTGRFIMESPAVNPAVVVSHSDTAQQHLAFTFPGVSLSDDRYYAAALVSLALGGGMNSRLFTEVREKRGLAYSVGSRFEGMEKTGLNRVYVGTQPDRAAESVEVVRSELKRLESDSISSEELELARTRLKSAIVMNSESTGNRMSTIARDWWYRNKLRTLGQIREEIDAVDLDAVEAYLQSIHLTENLGLVAIGPRSAAELGVEDRAFQVAP